MLDNIMTLNLEIVDFHNNKADSIKMHEVIPYISFEYIKFVKNFASSYLSEPDLDFNYFLKLVIKKEKEDDAFFFLDNVICTDPKYLENHLLDAYYQFIEFYDSIKEKINFNSYTATQKIFSKINNFSSFYLAVINFLELEADSIIQNIPHFKFQDQKPFFYAVKNDFKLKDIIEKNEFPEIHEFHYVNVNIRYYKEIEYFFTSKTLSLSLKYTYKDIERNSLKGDFCKIHLDSFHDTKNLLFFSNKKEADNYLKSNFLKLHKIIENKFSDIVF